MKTARAEKVRKEKDRAAERANLASGKATMKQAQYLDGLLITCGFTTRVARNDFLSRETEREIHFLDDLTHNEAHRLIGMLEERRDGDRERERIKRGGETGDGDANWNRR